MKPEAKHTTFDQGTEYVHRRKNGIGLTISYYRHLSNRFVMDVKIVNTTDSVLRVDARQFSYDACGGGYAGSTPGDSTEVIASQKAINPEKELLNKDMAISRSVAHQKTGNLFYGIGEALTIAGSFNDSTRAQRDLTINFLEQNEVNHQINNQNRTLQRRNLRDQRKVWEVDALRKTDLFPNEYIRGDVFFKNEPHAHGYWIYFDVARTHFQVFFVQQRYNP